MSLNTNYIDTDEYRKRQGKCNDKMTCCCKTVWD